MVDPGEKVSQTVRREFSEEALNSLTMTPKVCGRPAKPYGFLNCSGNEVSAEACR